MAKRPSMSEILKALEDRQTEKSLKFRAEAAKNQRLRAGTWAGGVKAHVEYQRKPVEWIVEKLGVPEHTIRWSLNPGYTNHEWDGDSDPIIKALEALADWKDVGIESATGTGKTFIAACIVLWFLACYEGAQIITAAPKEDQLRLHIWKEIGRLWPKFQPHFPEAELLTGKIRMTPAVEERETWAATAFVCGVGADEEIAQRAAGFHAEHQLWITEETPGIHSAIMNTIQHTRTDDHNLQLALGNPDHRNDSLHRFCVDEWVTHIRISALDHPNVVTGESIIPGAIGKRRLEQRTARYGRGSRLYESRIRGICPAEAEDALIKWEWCERAAKRYDEAELRAGERALGVDVANSESGDKAAIARWIGACLTEVEDFPCPNASDLGIRVYQEATDRESPVDPRYIGVDSVGVGASTINKLRELGMKVRFLSGGEKAVPGLDTDVMWSEIEPDLEGKLRPTGPKVFEAERFDLLRSQIWWRMREDLRLDRIALPHDLSLFEDLCTPTFTTRNGKICVEKKEDIVRRLRHSPNKGDAACYGNFVRRRGPAVRSVNSPFQAEKEPDRDVGLEKFLKRQAQKAVREKRREDRILAQMARRRRKGKR